MRFILFAAALMPRVMRDMLARFAVERGAMPSPFPHPEVEVEKINRYRRWKCV